MTESDQKTLEAVINVLDDFLGDTDLQIPPKWTSKDIRNEEPILWAMQQLVSLRYKGPFEEEEEEEETESNSHQLG